MNNLRPYLAWLRKQLSELDEIWDNLDREPALVHEIHIAAGAMAEEAGERAVKLGLPDLHAKSLPLIGQADPHQVKTFLSECIQACQPAKAKDDWLTVADVADQLGVAPRTVYRLREEKKLPHQHVGSGRGTIRVRPADLVALEKKMADSGKSKQRITLEQLRAL